MSRPRIEPWSGGHSVKELSNWVVQFWIFQDGFSPLFSSDILSFRIRTNNNLCLVFSTSPRRTCWSWPPRSTSPRALRISGWQRWALNINISCWFFYFFCFRSATLSPHGKCGIVYFIYFLYLRSTLCLALLNLPPLRHRSPPPPLFGLGTEPHGLFHW